MVQVGRNAITNTVLNQWMTSVVGEDFYAVSTHQAPTGLVSEPPNYPACVAALKRIEPIPGEGRPQPQPTLAELRSRCHQLYQAIRYQTLTFLVASYWTIDFASSHGIKVIDQEVQQQLKRLKAEQYPKEAEFQRYLADKRRILSEELFDVKLELLQRKLLRKAQTDGKFAQEIKRANATATCRVGYVVEHCKQFKSPGGYPGSSPAVQLQEIARWRPETSHGFTGVPVK